MRQNVYILYNKYNAAAVDLICEKIFINRKFFSEDLVLTEDILRTMATDCKGEYFYVIVSDKEVLFPSFDFSFKPQSWDSEYVHIWSNSTVLRLYNTNEVSRDVSKYTDAALEKGNIKLKDLPEKVYMYPVYDIVFLSYDEEYANTNYNRLKNRFPRAKRVHKIRGILEAHKEAASIAHKDLSAMFYVVDADAEILPSFNFDYQPPSLDRNSVHVWHSRNPVNDLEYGYGGIKLFPTNLLMSYAGSPIDFTTSVAKSFKVMHEVSNITKFNTDPFSAWRSGFRECVKLASKIIPNQDNTETEYRLTMWCTKGADREFGDFTILGANEGAEFGREHINQPEQLKLINDFLWLEKRFNS
jgi:hypothetical protein